MAKTTVYLQVPVEVESDRPFTEIMARKKAVTAVRKGGVVHEDFYSGYSIVHVRADFSKAKVVKL